MKTRIATPLLVWSFAVFGGSSSGAADAVGRGNGSRDWTHCDPSAMFGAWTPMRRFLNATVDASSARMRWI